MKSARILYRYNILIIVTALLLMQCNHPPGDATYTALDSLLNNKEYFKLEDRLTKQRDDLSPPQQLYFEAFINNAFNRNRVAAKQVDSLLKNYSSSFNDTVKVDLLRLQEDCYFKLFDYAKAANVDSTIINGYAASLDSSGLADVKNSFLLRNGLRNVPPQLVSRRTINELPWKRNILGLITIPIEHRGDSFNCIFDTRANISSITETYAKKLGLRILPVTYDEGAGLTGITFKTGLGVADSLYIGNILIRNAVFQVMPDSILYIAPLKVSLDVILGFPVIAALGEVHILKDGQMIIPQYPTKNDLHNFALDKLDPVLLLKTGNDTLNFNFDLGAGNSDLYYAFFQKYKSRIMKEAHQRHIQLGGAGGIQKKTVYTLPSLELTLGNKTVTLDSVDIFTQKISPEETLYGNIGIDFASKFNELILNFDQMYVKGS